MRRLRSETEQGLLGNGWCTRLREIDCRYETICETCSCFSTTIEFPHLQAQHDDALDRDQADRVTLYQNLLTRLDDQTAWHHHLHMPLPLFGIRFSFSSAASRARARPAGAAHPGQPAIGITYPAWPEVGVPAATLKAAGIPQRRRPIT